MILDEFGVELDGNYNVSDRLKYAFPEEKSAHVHPCPSGATNLFSLVQDYLARRD